MLEWLFLFLHSQSISVFKAKVKQHPGSEGQEQDATEGGTTESQHIPAFPPTENYTNHPTCRALISFQREKDRRHKTTTTLSRKLIPFWRKNESHCGCRWATGHHPGQDIACFHYDLMRRAVISVVFYLKAQNLSLYQTDHEWGSLRNSDSPEQAWNCYMWGGAFLGQAWEGHLGDRALHQSMDHCCFHSLDKSTVETWKAGIRGNWTRGTGALCIIFATSL